MFTLQAISAVKYGDHGYVVETDDLITENITKEMPAVLSVYSLSLSLSLCWRDNPLVDPHSRGLFF
jgi:hypothetical protein